eukprot:765500-Hanusia_phi.AAC.3
MPLLLLSLPLHPSSSMFVIASQMEWIRLLHQLRDSTARLLAAAAGGRGLSLGSSSDGQGRQVASYLRRIDREGGIYKVRWSEATIHFLATTLFLASQVTEGRAGEGRSEDENKGVEWSEEERRGKEKRGEERRGEESERRVRGEERRESRRKVQQEEERMAMAREVTKI